MGIVLIQKMIEELNIENKTKLSLYYESNLYTLKLNGSNIGQTMRSLREVENSLFLITDLLREVNKDGNQRFN